MPLGRRGGTLVCAASRKPGGDSDWHCNPWQSDQFKGDVAFRRVAGDDGERPRRDAISNGGRALYPGYRVSPQTQSEEKT